MARLQITEVVSYNEFSFARFRSQDGDDYEILFSRNFTSKKGGEHFELVSVERFGEPFSMNHPIWYEILAFLEEQPSNRVLAA